MTAPRTDGGPVRRLLRYLTVPERALRWSAVLTLIALGLMVWSMARRRRFR